MLYAGAVWLMCAVLLRHSAASFVQPQDCTWEPIRDAPGGGGGSGGVSMACSVRTLRAGHNPTNFSLIMPDHTVQLAVRCDEPMFQSELADGAFEHLYGLRSLDIEHCKLDRLPADAFRGLANLERLAVKTFNTHWSYRFALAVASRSFTPLPNVRSIDLSENGVESLPADLFCGLRQLRFVNLTRNAFSDVLSLGFGRMPSSSTQASPYCTASLHELEVSHNAISVLPDDCFASLARLGELRLDHNRIARAEPGALAGLVQLERLDMAHNRLVALPATLFQSTPRLSELYLRNNSLSALPPGLFAGLGELAMLDLAHNQLSALGWLGPDVVALASLHVLDLSHNRLTRLDGSAFRSLANLKILQLHNNLIEYVADGTFTSLGNLQTLILSDNRLQRIGPLMMAGLGTSLMTLQLDNNRLTEIDGGTFTNTSMLQELNLAGNRLTVVPSAVSALPMLRSLDLADNEIRDVANVSYQGLDQLYALNLMGNKLRNLSQGAFDGLPSVRILNLARNSIQTIEQGTFDEISSLHYLRLDSNAIEDVNGLFSNMHDLIMLNISVNRVRWFDYALIPVGLQWLDIHDNRIEALGNYFELEQNLRLRTLDASFNKLTDLDSSSLPAGIEIVFLKNNNLRRIQPFTFLGKQNLTRVDLSYNQLVAIDMPAFQLSDVPARRPLPEFAIGGNPFVCDCRLEWLQRLTENGTLVGAGSASPSASLPVAGSGTRKYPHVVDMANVECRLSFAKNVGLLPLAEVKSSQFLCEYKKQCFSLCHCCDFDGCECEVACPDNCTCYHDRSWTTNIVDCSARQHGGIPKRLAMDVTEVYVDGNDIPTIGAPMFAGRKSIRSLFVNRSNVLAVEQHAFSALSELRVLHLEDNHISALRGHEFDGLGQLRELYLFSNRISYVSNVTFAQLKSLEVLHLNRNRLVDISLWSLQYNPRLIEVRLAQNPWTCDCPFTQDLAQFLHERGDAVSDIFQLACAYNESTVLPLWELNLTDCRSLSTQATSSVRRFQFRRIGDLLPVLAAVFASFLLLLVGIVVVVVCRHTISVWLFGRCGIRLFHRAPSGEEEKLFDAFVSYSKKDEAFVAQILAPELECGNPAYRLCLHYRDLPMAGGYLSEAIQEAVESSRRTIVILSEHFLKSEWCRYEFKSAHHEVLSSSSSHKLVVIFIGRVSYRELDPDIRMWLKHSTFLHWGERNFWDKLRYAMPVSAPRHHRKVMRADLQTVAVHI